VRHFALLVLLAFGAASHPAAAALDVGWDHHPADVVENAHSGTAAPLLKLASGVARSGRAIVVEDAAQQASDLHQESGVSWAWTTSGSTDWVHNTCFPSASRIGELRQAVGVLRGGGYANPVVRRQIIESATNGATFSRLNAARVAQVRSVVERLGQPVHLVGSRVNPGKVLNPYSDFDFVIGGLRSKTRRFALDNLPAGYGPSGERLVDIFESGLAPGEPSITFFLP
jgi:hypothetical protein